MANTGYQGAGFGLGSAEGCCSCYPKLVLGVCPPPPRKFGPAAKDKTFKTVLSYTSLCTMAIPSGSNSPFQSMNKV